MLSQLKYMLNIFTADCSHRTGEMKVVDTIWELHTLIAIKTEKWSYHIPVMGDSFYNVHCAVQELLTYGGQKRTLGCSYSNY